jgi:hydrogenase maturation protease
MPTAGSIGVSESTGKVRVLCLGNDLVADDGIGLSAAAEIRRRLPGVEVVEEVLTGMYLIDQIIGVDRLIVVDAILTGDQPPGSVHVLHEGDVTIVPGVSPHYVGLFESLEIVHSLELGSPDVTLVCVEVKDALTIGGAMSDEVRAAIPEVVAVVAGLVGDYAAV